MEELALEEVPGRPVELTHLRLEGRAVLHELHECVDRRARNADHEARQVLENHALLLGEFGTQERTEEGLIEFDDAVEDPLAVHGAVRLEAGEVRVKEIERRRELHIGRVDEDETVGEASRRVRREEREPVDEIALAVDHHDRTVLRLGGN